jgi:hypothetical protein
MKLIITESQLKNIIREWGSDDMDFRPAHKIGNRTVDKLNKDVIGGGLSSGKPWTEHPKYKSDNKSNSLTKKEEEKEKKKEELKKEKEKEWNLRVQQQKEKDEKDNLEKGKSKEELERIKNDERIAQYEYTVLSILSELGKVDGEMKITDLVNGGKMDGKIVKHIMDKIERQHEKMKTIYRKWDKFKAKDIVNSYINDGVLDSKIVKYIRLQSLRLR